MTLTPEDRNALIANYKRKSREMIQTVEFLLHNNQLTLAVNRIYYGIYYMLSALALKYQMKTSKHAQLIGWFNKTFVKTKIVEAKHSEIIQNAFESRMDADYNVLSSFDKPDVEQLFEQMKEVLPVIEQLIAQKEDQQ